MGVHRQTNIRRLLTTVIQNIKPTSHNLTYNLPHKLPHHPRLHPCPCPCLSHLRTLSTSPSPPLPPHSPPYTPKRPLHPTKNHKTPVQTLHNLLRKQSDSSCKYDPTTTDSLARVTFLVARRLGEGRVGFSRSEMFEHIWEVCGDVLSKTEIKMGVQTVVNGAFSYVKGEHLGGSYRGTRIDGEEEEEGLRVLEREWKGVSDR